MTTQGSNPSPAGKVPHTVWSATRTCAPPSPWTVDAAARGVGAASLLETVPSGHGGIRSLCYAADGLRVLSGGQDGRLRLWRAEDDPTKAGTL